MTTYQQGAWLAVHISQYKKNKIQMQQGKPCKCSGCAKEFNYLSFVKMDSNFFGVQCCQECYLYAQSHIGILKLEYPPKAKKDKGDSLQYKLGL